jgi:hypothetical protein
MAITDSRNCCRSAILRTYRPAEIPPSTLMRAFQETRLLAAIAPHTLGCPGGMLWLRTSSVNRR